jgi:hypothetical protein
MNTHSTSAPGRKNIPRDSPGVKFSVRVLADAFTQLDHESTRK